MTFEEEEVLFNNIKSGHNNNYLIADTSWRVFLKIDGDSLYTCHSVKKGWSYEEPGEINKQFQFVEVCSVFSDYVMLKLESKTIKVEVLNSDASHYFGR
jgi:hypothetical protein